MDFSCTFSIEKNNDNLFWFNGSYVWVHEDKSLSTILNSPEGHTHAHNPCTFVSKVRKIISCPSLWQPEDSLCIGEKRAYPQRLLAQCSYVRCLRLSLGIGKRFDILIYR